MRAAPGSVFAWSLTLTAVLATFAGCLDDGVEVDVPTPGEAWVPADVAWDRTAATSKPLVKGAFDALPVEILPVSSFDGTRINTAVWRPNVPDGQKVPVIVDVGPYFGDEIERASSSDASLFVDGIVPHGFAFARAAVRGTSSSGGCQEIFSLNEQKDVDEVVTFYGQQPWSNGNVALYGLSYDGTTTWIGAQFGNPHLKTIVPISGLTSIYDHSYVNGTPWFFAPALHANYWVYGFDTQDRTPQDKAENACPEIARSAAVTGYTTVTGERTEPPAFEGYWADRDFKPGMLANYEGSVYVVQGLQDWRVPPHMAFPLVNDLQAKGLDVKMLLGQWWHGFPDSTSRDQHVRYDFAESLVRWFRQSLYEQAGVNTGPAVDVEDNLGLWRTEATWPPADAQWTPFHLGDGALETGPTAAGTQPIWGPFNAPSLVHDRVAAAPVAGAYEATTGPLAAELRFAGLARLHATFTVTSPEGHRLYAQLLDRDPAGAESVVAHAVMDTRYFEGGYERHRHTPGQEVLARMQFFPADVAIPAGHQLVLRVVGGSGYSGERAFADTTGPIDQFHESPTPLPLQIVWGEGASVLELPIIHRDVGDGTYPGQP